MFIYWRIVVHTKNKVKKPLLVIIIVIIIIIIIIYDLALMFFPR